MIGQTPTPNDNGPCPLQVETDHSGLSQNVASGRGTRVLWTGFGFAVLMLVGLLAPEVVVTPNDAVAFNPILPGSGLRGTRPRLNIAPPVAPVAYPVYSMEKRMGSQMRMSMGSEEDGIPLILPKSPAAATETSIQGGLITEVDSLDSFNALVAQTSTDDSILVVKFYFRLCPACRNMAPRFMQFARRYSGKKIRFAEVEVKKHRDIAKKLGITHAPSVHFYVGSKKEEDFVCTPKNVNILKERLDDYNENGIAAIAHSTIASSHVLVN